MRCRHCSDPNVCLKCKHCKNIYYCGSECGIKNWKNIHQFECIGMKRTIEDTFEYITLISKEGVKFKISVDDASESQTIKDFIADNGTENPMELKYISTEILEIIVNYLKTDKELRYKDELYPPKEKYHLGILTILAANYLHIDSLIKKLIWGIGIDYITPYEKYIYKDDGFTEIERELLDYLKKYDILVPYVNGFFGDIYVHEQPMRDPPADINDYNLLDVPKDVIKNYFLSYYDFFSKFKYEGWYKFVRKIKKWLNVMNIFRMSHAYFFNLVTNFVIEKAREKFDFLKDYTNAEVLLFLERTSKDLLKKDKKKIVISYLE